MRVTRKKPRNPLDLPWWAILGFEWIISQSDEYILLGDVLIEAWTKESDDEVYIQFIWPGGRHGLVSVNKDTPREFENDMSTCPAYNGVGTCQSGCYTEPACQTSEPEFGWPSKRYKF